MKERISILSLLLIVFSQPVFADEIYVCADPSGRKLYSSTPCSGDQKLIKQESVAPGPQSSAVNPYAAQLDRVVQGYIQDGNFEQARSLASTAEQWQWIREAEEKERAASPAVIVREPVILNAGESNDDDDGDIDYGWWMGVPTTPGHRRLWREERERDAWWEGRPVKPREARGDRGKRDDRGGRADGGRGSRRDGGRSSEPAPTGQTSRPVQEQPAQIRTIPAPIRGGAIR